MHFEWLHQQNLAEVDAFLTALAIGLLMGMERERSPSAKAGLRTFALVALLGVALAMIGERTGTAWLPAVGLALVGLTLIAANLRGDAHEADPGTTTVIATLVCYALATMVWFGFGTLAIMLAVASTALLYFKTELRSLTLGLERTELISILQFAVLTFVVLPILPDRDLGPFGAVNPRQIWFMVVLVAGVSLAGYLALRMVGQRYGALLLGLFGGLVSSTATTLVYARHGRDSPALASLAATVIVIANLVLLVRISVVVAVVNPQLVASLLPVTGAGLLAGLLAAFPAWRRPVPGADSPVPVVTNPAELRTSLGFGAVYGAVLLLAAWASHELGSAGFYGLALVSGLTDVDAITLSALRLNDLGQLAAGAAVTGITLAMLTNIAFKFGLVFVTAGPALALRCLAPMAGSAAGLVAGLLWIR
jgi:uncharacterized membrane protein (DUF4010 family)